MANIQIETVKERLQDYIKKDVLNLYTVTGRLGVELDGEKKFFEAAKKAASIKTPVKENSILWVPLLWQNQVLVVCGLKTKKDYPEESIRVLEGLLDEITYEEFLKSQTKKLIDPRSNFVKALLETDQFKTMEQAIDMGDILGINLRSPQAAIFIKIPGLYKEIINKYRGMPKENMIVKVSRDRQAFMHKLSNAFDKNENNIIAYLEPDHYVVLKWARGQVNTLNSINFFKKKADFIKEIIEKETGITPTIGVGQYYPNLAGLRKSYRDARVALELGQKIWGESRNYHIVDVGMFIALSPKITFERKCELAYQILGPIFNDKSLYKTVSVFLENDMNLTEAARKLHLHRNTLIYRLDKVKKDIGLDPRKFSDAIQIKLGMILYSPSQVACET